MREIRGEIPLFKSSHFGFEYRIDVRDDQHDRTKTRYTLRYPEENAPSKMTFSAQFIAAAPKFRYRYSCRFADGKYARMCLPSLYASIYVYRYMFMCTYRASISFSAVSNIKQTSRYFASSTVLFYFSSSIPTLTLYTGLSLSPSLAYGSVRNNSERMNAV